MEKTNFCRQLRKHLLSNGEVMADRIYNIKCSDFLFKLQMYPKFILPEGGMCLKDNALKGLDENLELHLPYRNTIFEYLTTEVNNKTAIKVILILETIASRIRVSIFEHDYRGWKYTELMEIPISGYITRENTGKPKIARWIDGNINYDKDVYLHNVNIISNVVMSFLNALACSNIYIHKEQSKQPHKLKKDALPFDDYHVLMLNNNHSNEESGEHNSHRHPRQHLRRGHIRRYKSGITIWINSMVVCPETKTKIIKDYKVV